MEICINPDHPYRSHLVFDKKRHPEVAKQTNRSQQRRRRRVPQSVSSVDSLSQDGLKSGDEDSINGNGPRNFRTSKLLDFFGEKVPSRIVPSNPSIKSPPMNAKKKKDKKSSSQESLDFLESQSYEVHSDSSGSFDALEPTKKSKLNSFFGEKVPVIKATNNSKLFDFFGEDDLEIKPKMTKKLGIKNTIKGLMQKSPKVPDMPIIPVMPSGSKKLVSFFGERPPENLIAENLDLFFPGFNAQRLSGNNTHGHDKNMSDILPQSEKPKSTSQNFVEKLKHFNSSVGLDPKKALNDNSDDEDDYEMVDAKTIFHKEAIEELHHSLEKAVEIIPLSNDTDYTQKYSILRPKSILDFLEVFQVAPDTAVDIQWIQGPLIGLGAFGKVFYGANVLTGEIMAVKQVPLRSPNMDQKSRRKMLFALHLEIELLKDLDHPNIVRYLGNFFVNFRLCSFQKRDQCIFGICIWGFYKFCFKFNG
jgi:hypothetical protein